MKEQAIHALTKYVSVYGLLKYKERDADPGCVPEVVEIGRGLPLAF
jgi:hypothetical protein